MVSRTTDDYATLARMGCVGLSEPAFWAGFDRSGPEGFRDYFRQLTTYEPNRARDHGIAHCSWLCINAKEAENIEFSREVINLIPPLLNHPRVLGVGVDHLGGPVAAAPRVRPELVSAFGRAQPEGGNHRAITDPPSTGKSGA